MMENEDFIRRQKIRKRKATMRRRHVVRMKISVVLVGVFVLVGIVSVLLLFLPSYQVKRLLNQAGKLTEQSELEKAQEVYAKVIEKDETVSDAYIKMADNYVALKQPDDAEKILGDGFEKTGDERLHHYYCTVILNQAVAEINGGNITIDTLDKCVRVLMKDPMNEDAFSLLETCHGRFFKEDQDSTGASQNDTAEIGSVNKAFEGLFVDNDVQKEECGFTEYCSFLRDFYRYSLLQDTKEVRELLVKYLLLNGECLPISEKHLNEYKELLQEINVSLESEQIDALLLTIESSEDILEYFTPAFEAFTKGKYEFARDFIIQDRYKQLRDSFIDGTSGNWKGDIYIPVSREQVVFEKEEDGWKFRFPGADEYSGLSGIITVCGTKQEDDGIRRSVIVYEPSQNPDGISHMEYRIQYLYSNVKINGEYVPQMNYRLDTSVTTEDGITTTAIGDWGGAHEYEIDY